MKPGDLVKKRGDVMRDLGVVIECARHEPLERDLVKVYTLEKECRWERASWYEVVQSKNDL